MFCKPQGSKYTTFDEAKMACSFDSSCKMFYDACGRGTEFYHCNGSLAEKVNSTGCKTSVLYEKLGK